MSEKKKGAAFFPVLFGLISLMFIVILIVAYRLTKLANPIMLDEQGKPTNAAHH
jgi:hypothetical protein